MHQSIETESTYYFYHDHRHHHHPRKPPPLWSCGGGFYDDAPLCIMEDDYDDVDDVLISYIGNFVFIAMKVSTRRKENVLVL